MFNEVYANLTVLPQLNDYSECNHTYFGLFSGVNSVIEDQSVYITKKPDDIKTTVGETIRIEVRNRDVCERSSSECVNSFLTHFEHSPAVIRIKLLFAGRVRRLSRAESLLDESGE